MSVATGSRHLLARDAGAGSFRWLREGRVAYLDRRGGFVVRHPDGTMQRRRLGLPASALSTLAIAPDGDRLLYTKGCDVWLENLRTRSVRRFAHARYSPTRVSWSPTGAHVALAASSWRACDEDFDWYHAGTALFDGRGRELDRLPGGVVDWSTDDRFLLASGGVTGTAVTAAQPLVLDDLGNRSRSTLMPSRSTGIAVVLPQRRIVFGRYDNPAAVGEKSGGGLRPRLYFGRLVGR